ncbi:PEP/pyruvate-binding domain-containing protein [Neisseria sp. 27098_8_158]|uniref:PEP/pyruvate-binding domain-containing protein n=1 Tax=Neisseria sp. 27098_8_158 TaxID=3003680 RepID=UPI00352D7AF2
MKPAFCLPILFLLSACRPEAETVDTAAPTARKPSYYESEKRQTAVTPVKTQVPALSAIKSQADFDLLSRIYEQGNEYEIPHILFLIDREDDGRTDYINTPKFRLHEHYLATILKPMLSKSELNQQYRSPNRRYLFGTISWQNSTQEYVYEFWEGDKITPELLKLAAGRLKDSFYAPLRYKTNSLWQETVAEQSKVPFITQESLIKNFPYLPLNQGKAIGTLRVIAKEDDLYNVGADDIIILKEVPLELPPVAGIISEKPSTALSHVNVLARGWGIPNIYLKDAEKILAPYIGRRIEFEATAKQYRIVQNNRNTTSKSFSDGLTLPQPDVSDYSLRALANLHRDDSRYCGSKAANLGHIRAHIAGSNVPDGFCIPFAYYQAMMDRLGINAATLIQIETQSGGDNRKRRTALLTLQKKITDAEIPSEWKHRWAEQWRSQLNSKGVFVRSSSNSEDLPNFSGAGLYTTVPNVTDENALVEAVKQSWASVFNYSTYEARRIAGLPHDSVKMSVFVQQSINADLSGVLVTINPYDTAQKNSSYIAAKRGLGIRVVEGKRVAEQVVYNRRNDSVQRLSSSNETTALQLDKNGGVREVPVTSGNVMNQEQIRRLDQTGQRIKQLFANGEQDIEWAFDKGKLVILQARPYLNGTR